jgi:hypothetical protein
LAVGLAFFALCSLLREAIQPHLANAPYLNALLTVVTFVLPGAFVGACSAQHSLRYGVILGVLAGAFVTLQLGHFAHVNWGARQTLQIFGTFAGIGIILCEIGALAGRALARTSRSSNSGRLREP